MTTSFTKIENIPTGSRQIQPLVLRLRRFNYTRKLTSKTNEILLLLTILGGNMCISLKQVLDGTYADDVLASCALKIILYMFSLDRRFFETNLH